MGGGDKGLLELAGKPMLRHVIDRLAPQVSTIVINANGDPQRFAAFALPVVADTVEGFVGPLAGVLAGMRWSASKAPKARWIVTAAGDAPLLPRDLVERMMAGRLGARGHDCTGAVGRRDASRDRALADRARAGSRGAAEGRRAQGAALDRPARHGAPCRSRRSASAASASIRSTTPTRRRSWASCAPCCTRARHEAGRCRRSR